jgi:predicted metal-dependent peptidase
MHEKIMQSCQEMLIDLTVNLPYYGNFLLFMSFHERRDMPTCGVNVTARGMNFYYNPLFLDGKTQKEVNFIVIHEEFHLLWNHPKRTVTGQYNAKMANIVQDMIINHIIWEDISHTFVDIPRNSKGKHMTLFIPKEYTGNLIFEELYEWMREEQEKWKKKKKCGKSNCSSCNGTGKKQKQPGRGQGQGQQPGQGQGQDRCPDCNGTGAGDTDSAGNPSYGQYGRMPSKNPKDKDETIETYSLDSLFDNLDESNGEYLDQHMGDEVPEEMRDSIVKDAQERLRSRGFEEANITETLNKLRKKKKDYLSHIKRSLSNQIFGNKKLRTITKPNRRGIFGLKGHRKVKTKITVILDTSGSMGGTFERVLSYIYRNDIEMNLIEADTSVKWIQNIKSKRQLESMPIHGHGGTILQPAINMAVERFNNTNLLVLTDGLCDNLDISAVRGNVLMISIDTKVPIAKSNGKLKQIVVGRTEK